MAVPITAGLAALLAELKATGPTTGRCCSRATAAAGWRSTKANIGTYFARPRSGPDLIPM